MSRLKALADQGELEFREATSSGNSAVTIKAPSSLAASYDLTLPSALPSETSYVTLGTTGTIATVVPETFTRVSTEIEVDSSPQERSVQIAHGLSSTPDAGKILLGCYISAVASSPWCGFRNIYIESVDATYVTVHIYFNAYGNTGQKLTIVAWIAT